MNRSKLIQILSGFYNAAQSGRDISLFNPSSIPLLAEMTDRQRAQLESGSGNPIAEMQQINSSAGMAFNYYKLFEEVRGVEVDFEWKESIPLTKSSLPANLDVRYETKDGVITFVECKFLEPYYSTCERNRAAYFDKERYPFADHRDEWEGLMKKEKDFKYYNIAQIFRHLLAIYRHTLEYPDIYAGKKIVLKSVMWKMSDAFLERYNKEEKGRNAAKNKERLDTLFDEKKRATAIINEHAQKIGWTDFSFESEFYNDITNDIKGAMRFNDFMAQYALN
jgi:hypothetical protein